MYAPPSDPRHPNAPLPTDLRHLVAAFLLTAVIPLGLFVASYPLVGAAGLVGPRRPSSALVGPFAGRRRLGGTLRRLRDRPLQFDLPGGVRLRIVRHPAERPPEDRATDG
jgi:hypothetical protein